MTSRRLLVAGGVPALHSLLPAIRANIQRVKRSAWLLAGLLFALPLPARGATTVAFQGIADASGALSPGLLAQLDTLLRSALSARGQLVLATPEGGPEGPRFTAEQALSVVVQAEGGRLLVTASLVDSSGIEHAHGRARFDRPRPADEPAAMSPVMEDLAAQLSGAAPFGRDWPARPTGSLVVATDSSPPPARAVAAPVPPPPPEPPGDWYVADLGLFNERRHFYGLASLSAWSTRVDEAYAPLVFALGTANLEVFRGGVVVSGLGGHVRDFAGGVQLGLFESGADHFVGLVQAAPWSHAGDFTGLAQLGLVNDAPGRNSGDDGVAVFARLGGYHAASVDVAALLDVALIHRESDASFTGALRAGLYDRTRNGDFRGALRLSGASYLGGDFRGGLDLGLANVVEGQFAGIAQIGVLNMTGDSFVRAFFGDEESPRSGPHDFRGLLQLATMNVVDGDFAGVLQVGLTGNIVQNDARALGQIGYFYNWVEHDYSGVLQLAMANVAERVYALVQVGAGNVVTVAGHGAQVGVANVTIGEQDGVQLGVANAVRELYGAQIGLFNYAVNDVYGVQLGVVNVTERLRGVQLGVVNLSGDGGLPWTVVANAGF